MCSILQKFSGRLLFIATLSILSASNSGAEQPTAQLPDPECGALRRVAIEAWKSNRAKLGDVSMKVSEWLSPTTDGPVPLADRINAKMNGVEVELTIGRLPSTNSSSILVGQSNFFERRFVRETTGPHSSWQFRDGVWSEYDFELKRVVIRNASQLPSLIGLDPHQVLGQDTGTSLEEFLLKCELVTAERLPESESGSGSIRIVLARPDKYGSISLTFGEKNRYLPVRASRLTAEGVTLAHQTFEYQLVASRDALMLQSAKTVVHVNPDASEGHRLISFSGEQSFFVDEFTLLADGDLDRLRIRPGEKWLVQDLTVPSNNASRVIEEKVSVAPRTSLQRLILLVNAVVVIGLLVLFRQKLPFFRKNCSGRMGD